MGKTCRQAQKAAPYSIHPLPLLESFDVSGFCDRREYSPNEDLLCRFGVASGSLFFPSRLRERFIRNHCKVSYSIPILVYQGSDGSYPTFSRSPFSNIQKIGVAIHYRAILPVVFQSVACPLAECGGLLLFLPGGVPLSARKDRDISG